MKNFILTMSLFSLWACQAEPSYKTLKIAEAKEYVENAPQTVWLDVRTSDEVARGKIEGALHADVNADNFKEVVSGLDKSKTYMVYCKSGGRSAKASDILTGLGFTVINMGGGFDAWVSAGYLTH